MSPVSNRDEQVLAEQARLLYASIPILSNAQLIGVALFLYAFMDHGQPILLFGWAAYQLLMVLLRHDLAVSFRRRAAGPAAVQHWNRRFSMATWAIALGWGITPLLFGGSAILRAFNLLVIALFAAGALSALSSSLTLYRGFLLLSAAPITLLALLGSAGPERAMGIAALAGMVYFWRAASHHHQVLTHSLSLAIDNQALAAARSASVEAFRSLFDAAPVPLMLVRRADGSVTRFNAEALTMAPAPGANPEGCYALERLFDESAWREFASNIKRLGDCPAQSITFGDDQALSRHFIVTSTTVEMDAEPAAIVGFQDVTRQTRYERELLQAKHQAEAAFEELALAQEELIRSEKLAALGGLVAGVAHEINTPLGNTLTAATHLADQAEQLRRCLASGALKRSDLDRFLDAERETTGVMLSNMQRAVALVQSFKQVAVDQTSDDRRVFDLGEYIDEVIVSLGPRLRTLPHRVVVDCPAGLAVDGYPGVLFQVLSNLVMNALIHAFGADSPGEMAITVSAPSLDEPLISLVFRDNGVGMSSELQKRIFDPFFTTRRGSGGTGLGLHIVYNLVTVTMNGQIEVASEPGKGSAFILRFPPLMPLAGA